LAVEGFLDTDDLSKCLHMLESFIVRRAICNLETKDYNKYFVEVVSRLRKSGASCEALGNIFSSGEGETRRFPDDLELASGWKSKPVYNKLSSAQLILLLQQLECGARTDRAEITPIPHISVEHVMPQQWTENYPLIGELVPKEMNAEWYFGSTQEDKARYERLQPHILNRRNLVQTIGNLTAVTQHLNAAMKNAGFHDKKSFFRESVLAMNRYFENLLIWDEAAIEKRSDKLFEIGVKLWPNCGKIG
jgi:hypothetical protein